jgi:GMP synthase-like glutamine amidotransferase
MKVHYIQHASFEKPGFIREFFQEKGVSQSVIFPYKNMPYPEPDEIEMLVIMGGPMSVNDEKKYPWLSTEKKFIEKAILDAKPVLGICLGSQLLASVLGSRVFPNTQKEIGWFPLTFAPELETYLSRNLPSEMMGFHWHGDTYELPGNTIRLASSAVTANQGFVYEDRVVGLQFHPETTRETLKDLITHGRQELVTDSFIQSEIDIMAGIHHASHGNKMIALIIERMLKQQYR